MRKLSTYAFGTALFAAAVLTGSTSALANNMPELGKAGERESLGAEAMRNRAIEIAQTTMAQLNSREKLDNYIAKNQARRPLSYLTPAARKRFLNSLTFNENGLSGFRYDDLEAELTFTQAYELLTLFGAQNRVFTLDLAVATEQDAKLFGVVEKSIPQVSEDHKEYRCADRYSCRASTQWICMSGCSPIMTP